MSFDIVAALRMRVVAIRSLRRMTATDRHDAELDEAAIAEIERLTAALADRDAEVADHRAALELAGKTLRNAMSSLLWQPIADAPKDVIADVAAERLRQVTDEGWTPEHDDQFAGGQLAQAGAAYAAHAGSNPDDDLGDYCTVIPHHLWPWSLRWWKPKSRRRDLVRAAALLIAEIERLDRAAQPLPAPPTEGGQT